MARKRKAYAPFSLTSEAGVAQTPLEGYIDVDQQIYPTVNTGTVNENGKWSGVKSSDVEFKQLGKELQVPNGQVILAPGGDPGFLDMTGFNGLFIAIKPTFAGSYPIAAIMGPDTNRFANLQPVDAASNLRGSVFGRDNLGDLLTATVTLTADVWNIFIMDGLFSNQKNMQFKITNSSGGNSDIETAFMRTV